MRQNAAKQGRAPLTPNRDDPCGLFQRLFGAPDRGTAPALYEAVTAQGRRPHWYEAGAVPDTIDGRFDMIAAVLAMVLLRLESEPAGFPKAPRSPNASSPTWTASCARSASATSSSASISAR
jgi:hypothetical protein